MEAKGMPRVSVVFPEQDPETAHAMGRAFVNDPVLCALLPEVHDPEERSKRLIGFFKGMLQIQRRSAQPVIGTVIDGKVVGAAIIDGVTEISAIGTVLNGLGRMPTMVGALGVNGLWRGIKLLDELSRNHPKEPHLYLNFIGVDPSYQRNRHCGSAMIQELKELAAQRPYLLGVYLETGTEENVGYYSSRGYEVLGEIHPLGVRMWRMLQRRR